MTRDELKKILEKEDDLGTKISDILDAFHLELEAEKTKTPNEKQRADNLQEQVDADATTIADLKKDTAGNDKLQEKITNHENTIAKLQQQLTQSRMDSAITVALTKAGARNNKAAAALLDVDKIQIADDGTVTGLDEQIKSLSKDKDTAFMFKQDPEPSQDTELNQKQDAPQQNYVGMNGSAAKPISLGEQMAQRARNKATNTLPEGAQSMWKGME